MEKLETQLQELTNFKREFNITNLRLTEELEISEKNLTDSQLGTCLLGMEIERLHKVVDLLINKIDALRAR